MTSGCRLAGDFQTEEGQSLKMHDESLKRCGCKGIRTCLVCEDDGHRRKKKQVTESSQINKYRQCIVEIRKTMAFSRPLLISTGSAGQFFI